MVDPGLLSPHSTHVPLVGYCHSGCCQPRSLTPVSQLPPPCASLEVSHRPANLCPNRSKTPWPAIPDSMVGVAIDPEAQARNLGVTIFVELNVFF